MKAADILRGIDQGRYAIWVDDKQDAPLTPEYLEANFVGFSNSPEEGMAYCRRLHEAERARQGKATTRYRISGNSGEYECREDTSEEVMSRIVETLPISEVDKRHVTGQLKKH